MLGHASHVVVVVDGATHAIDTTISFPASPYGVCYDSTDDRVYVATRADSTVRAIDCASNTIVATIPVGPSPNKLCWNSRENKVYTATSDGNDSTVSVIDCASNTVVATVSTGAYPGAVGYDPTESRVYVCNKSGRSISVVDGVTNAVVADIPTTAGPEAACAAPQYSHVFCAMGNDSVLVLDVTTNFVIARFAVGRRPSTLLYNPISSRMYSTDYNGATVSIMRGSAIGIVETPGHTAVAEPAPTVISCARLLVEMKKSNLLLFDPTGRAIDDPRHVSPGVLLLRTATTSRKVIVTE